MFKITWRERDEGGWYIPRRALVESPDEVRHVVQQLLERDIVEHRVKRVNG